MVYKGHILIIIIMSKREIKKTVISYQPIQKQIKRERSRSRDKKAKVEVVDASSRRARLAMLKGRKDDEQGAIQDLQQRQPAVILVKDLEKEKRTDESQMDIRQEQKVKIQSAVKQQQQMNKKIKQQLQQSQENEDSQQPERKMLKPVFISRQNRQQQHTALREKQQERKKKALRYTTKLLLLQNAKDQQQDQQLSQSSDDDAMTDLPDDDDTKNQQLEYQLWKVRELKRIRRDREQRRLIQKEKAELERRRKLNNEQILLQNKVMGSDATDNTTETKYVFMQKYYHRGAFYQDSQDPIFKRDYNLPTPLQMQDKSMLPEILQKRQGNFGKKGQSKYKHLTAQDTTNFDPQFRPDESILANWKKKTAGYKGARGSNI